ncbi:ferritin-like domain-containing protein [Pantanalinema rosaneae CENA516]|uniref:ferritin-like domain-containing protein n=1 Tax=Pantanalinema rosaneae TaxID=1620701 RepID=UPI003D6F6F37
MSEQLKNALTEALEDEYKARATYRLILSKFGAIRPFVNIVASEERHIQALIPLFWRYGLPIPEDSWAGRVNAPASVQEACQAGVQAEIENAAMYERLLDLTRGYPDVQSVFLNLQHASQTRHLPAFQRCADRGTGQPHQLHQPHHGRGGRRGQGCR